MGDPQSTRNAMIILMNGSQILRLMSVGHFEFASIIPRLGRRRPGKPTVHS